MQQEIVLNREQPRSHENLPLQSRFVGLHARLLHQNQDFLNPGKKFAESREQFKLQQFNERNYQPFQNASIGDRVNHWENKPQATFEEQYSQWKDSITGSFNNQKNMNTVNLLEPVFLTMGIKKDPEGGFKDTHAKQIYDRYFESDETTGVKLFVKDVLDTYSSQQDKGYTAITHHINEIEWLAKMFGENGQKMVKHLILSEITLKSRPEILKNAVQIQKDSQGNDVFRIDDLSDEERRILDFITANKTVKVQRNQPDITSQSGQEKSKKPKPEKKERKVLPIDKKKTEIQNAVRNKDTVIVIGGTGSGKTVRTPQFIREIMGEGSRLLITEPRQINTSSLAKRVAEEQNAVPVDEIGYAHGDDKNKYGEKADTVFMTEGLLLRKIASDPLLLREGWTHIMMDEVHVRSKDSELLLKTIKEIQKERAKKGFKKLKIIAASATVDKEKLEGYLPGSQTIEVEGETFPIEKHYVGDVKSQDMPRTSAQVVETISKSNKPGDVIIFVATIADIDKTIKELQKKNLQNTDLIRLHTGSTADEKKEVEREEEDLTPERRRVIVATNFAETGVTINGLKFVVNTGEEMERRVDPRSGFEYMEKIKQAQAGADQRSGRVGRTSPGDVYNLFTEADYDSRAKYPTAELERTDLTDYVLQLKKNKVQDILGINLLSTISPERVRYAEETLKLLGALDTNGNLTPIGKDMDNLPMDYHLARMVVEADQKKKGVHETCTIAAVSEGLRLILKGTQNDKARTLLKFRHPSSDFLTMLNLWNSYEANGKTQEWAEKNGLSYEALTKAEASRSKYLKRVKNKNTPPASEEELEKFIFEGHKDRIMKYDSAKWKYVPLRQKDVNLNLRIDPKSALAGKNPDYIIAASNNQIEDGVKIVYLSDCHTVKPEWINGSNALPLAA